jgi:hypothetical protein
MPEPIVKNERDMKEEAVRIIGLLKKDFVLESGALFLEKSPKGGIFKHHIFPDLGDVIPFFLYFKEEAFVKQQVKLYEQQLKNGILISEFASFKLRGLAKTYEYTDLLLGLASLFEHTGNAAHKRLLVETTQNTINIFQLNKRLSSFYYPMLRMHLPIIDTRDGTFIEIFTELSVLLKNDAYLSTAKNIFNKLIELPFYKEHGLLPTFHANLFVRVALGNDNRFSEAKLCKNNTNSLFGFLELYKETRDNKVLETIYSFVATIQERATIEEGGIVEVWSPQEKPSYATLTSSFPVLDFLCDLYSVTYRDEDKNFAMNIADFWIERQGKTGLFPLHSNGRETFFDSETDMTIALYKLFEITGEEKYKNAANTCYQGIRMYHGVHDYVLGVDIHTGEVTNPTQRTKFIALFLKLLIARMRIERGDSVLKTKWLYNLLKDR